MSNPATNAFTAEELFELQVETMIDASGLAHVVEMLAEVCAAKAEHLLSNWQDATASRAWEQAAKALDRCANSAAVRNVTLTP